MGATKDRGEAETQARTEAERRYGPRTPADYASWSMSTRRESRDLTTSEIDKAARQVKIAASNPDANPTIGWRPEH